MGSGYGITQCNAFLSDKGGSGFFMHAGSWDPRAANHYEVRNGRAYCEWVNVVWQLRDVTQEDGGCAVVPGTHKGRYPAPEDITTADDDPMGMIKHVPMKAGDVLFFLAPPPNLNELSLAEYFPRLSIRLTNARRTEHCGIPLNCGPSSQRMPR